MKSLRWTVKGTFNCIIGARDTCKTTILSALDYALARILHECANLAGIRDICAVAGRNSFDRAGAGSFDAVFGL